MGLDTEAGANRVVPDVRTRFGEVLVVAKHPGKESILEQMANPFVTFVEPLRMKPVNTVQALRKVLEVSLDDKVVVVPHQAVGVTPPLPATTETTYESDEESAVVVVEKDLGLGNPTGRDVVNAVTRQR